MRDLIRGGAWTGVKNVFGFSPLHAAAWHGDTDAIDNLLKAGASVNDLDNRNRTPLMLAAFRFGSASAPAAMLLSNGANANLMDDAGRTFDAWDELRTVNKVPR